jgi:hypothetical protein
MFAIFPEISDQSTALFPASYVSRPKVISEISTIRADSEHEKPAEGVRTNPSKLFPSLLIPARLGAKEFVQHNQPMQRSSRDCNNTNGTQEQH